MEPLFDYIKDAEVSIKVAQLRAKRIKKEVLYIETIMTTGWPKNWIYSLAFLNPDIEISFHHRETENPSPQEVRELKKSIMKYTKTMNRIFLAGTGRFCWTGKFKPKETQFKIIFTFVVGSDPNCTIKRVTKEITVYESTCQDE